MRSMGEGTGRRSEAEAGVGGNAPHPALPISTCTVAGGTVSTVTIQRRTTRQLHVGPVPVGGGAPVTVQSMTTTKTADVDGTLAQVYALAGAGADIVRITCNEVEAAQGLAEIIPRSPVPIIADIHYQYRLALAAIEAGVQGLRQIGRASCRERV